MRLNPLHVATLAAAAGVAYLVTPTRVREAAALKVRMVRNVVSGLPVMYQMTVHGAVDLSGTLNAVVADSTINPPKPGGVRLYMTKCVGAKAVGNQLVGGEAAGGQRFAPVAEAA